MDGASFLLLSQFLLLSSVMAFIFVLRYNAILGIASVILSLCSVDITWASHFPVEMGRLNHWLKALINSRLSYINLNYICIIKKVFSSV